MANLQIAIDSAFFKDTQPDSRFYISLGFKSASAESAIDQNKVHKTSLSSGKSSSAVFNVHSFNIGDIEHEQSTSVFEFKAYKVLMKQGKPISEELLGECKL